MWGIPRCYTKASKTCSQFLFHFFHSVQLSLGCFAIYFFFTYNVFWGFTEHSHHILHVCLYKHKGFQKVVWVWFFFFFFFLRMGQKASWKFLFLGSLQKSQVIKNLEEETFAAGKIFLPRNLEAGFVSSLWLHLHCFSEEQAKTSTKNCWEICLQIGLKSSMKTKIE